MATESDGGGAFRRRGVIAAAADAQACWEEYSALVRAAAEDPPQEGGATRRAEVHMELHRARAALLAAVEVRRLAVDEIAAERDDAGDDEGRGIPTRRPPRRRTLVSARVRATHGRRGKEWRALARAREKRAGTAPARSWIRAGRRRAGMVSV
jgi:hypothetical protein